MKKISSQDHDLRTAMLICYKHKCFYSGEPINIRAMDIDHIIPKEKKRKPEELKKFLRELGIEDDFELDSIYNFVPCQPSLNRSKGADDNIAGMIFWLHKAKKMAPIIIEEMNKLKNIKSIDRNMSKMKSVIIRGDEKAENIYDFLTDDDEDFPEIVEKYNVGTTEHYRCSDKNVWLNGTLPNFQEPTGYCSIVFRSLKIRGCIIDLNHKEILNYFFKGMNTDPTLHLRKFIIAPFYNNKSQYLVKFGNATFPLTLSELKQLCHVIDGYAVEYLYGLRSIEKYLGAGNMELSQNGSLKGGYRLISVRTELWDKMVEFTKKHDYENGSTCWHMFDANRYKIKVCTRDDDQRYSSGYHAILEPEKDINSYCSTEDIWIVWSPHLDFGKSEQFTEKARWNPQITLKWIIEEFIPQVYSYYTQLQRIKLSEHIGLVNYKECVNVNEIDDNKKLQNLVNELQSFYIGNEEIFVKGSEYEGLLSALSECLSKIHLKSYHYIARILGYRDAINMEDILKDLNSKKCLEVDQVLRSTVIDYYLRCMGEALDKDPTNMGKIDVKYIINCLIPFYECKQTHELIEKYKNI